MRNRIPLCLLSVLLGACGSSDAPVEEAAQETEVEPAPEPEPLPPGLAPIVAPFTGDLDGMVERRMVRILTVHSPVLYFIDRGRELGLAYENAQAFEDFLNKRLGSGNVIVHVLVVPVARDELIPPSSRDRGTSRRRPSPSPRSG